MKLLLGLRCRRCRLCRRLLSCCLGAVWLRLCPLAMHGGHVVLQIVSPGELGQALGTLEDALVRVIAQMGTQRVLAELLGAERALQQLVLANGGAACVKEAMIEQI